jgi:Tn3 transposase DDE domain
LDQFTGFHGIVIPGTLRDSMFILDGLLEQQTSLRPVEVMADTAGTSDIVFGLFWLLGISSVRGWLILVKPGSGASTRRPTMASSTASRAIASRPT